MTDREKLEKLAVMSRDLVALLGQQKATTAEMVRGCLSRLRSPDSRKRAEGIKGLEGLLEILEKQNHG